MQGKLPESASKRQAPAAAAQRLRLLIADDHELVRMALRMALRGLAARIDWLEASSVAEVERHLAAQPELDLALLDLNMPGTDAADWIGSLRRRHPTVPLIVVSAQDDGAAVRAALAQGVAGFIPKTDPPAVILQAVQLVLAGGSYVPPRLLTAPAAVASPPGGQTQDTGVAGLTPRQRDVMRLLGEGRPNKLIARELGLSEGTVKVHLLAIYRALGVHNRTEAVVAAQRAVQANVRDS